MQPDIVFDAFPKGESGAAVMLLIGGKLTPCSAISASSNEALHEAIKQLLPHDGVFHQVTIETHGSTTLACADMTHGGARVIGEGSHKDCFTAKAKAIVDAVSKIRARHT